MFLCFFLSIYFFGYFYPLFHSQKIIYIILHSKKRVTDATDFHSVTSYPSLFSVATRIIIWYITTDSFIFSGNSILCNTILWFYLFCRRYLFYGGVCYESLCDKRKVPTRIHSGSIQLLWLRYTGLFYECTAALAQWNGIKLHKIWKWFFQIRGSDHLCQTGRHLSDPAQRPSCYHVGWAQLFFYDTIVFHQNMLVEVTMTVVIQIFCCRFFSSRRRVLVPVSQETPGSHELHDSVRTIMQCAHKNTCNVGSVAEKRTAPLILSAGIDTGTLHRTHGFDRIPADRNTSACSHLYTETSFRICYHRAAGKDRSYEQQLLYELFQTEFRSRSHWISESGTYPISMRPSAQYGSQYLRHCFRYRIS